VTAKVQELELNNAKIETMPLPYERAEDLLPDIAQIIAKAFDQVSPEIAAMVQGGEFVKDDPRAIMALLPAISGILQQLGGGKLKSLAPRVLATTTIYLTNETGEKEKYDMVSKDDRARCFDARPDVYFPALFFAGKVTFGRFFPGAGRRDKKPALTTVA
jgi:hypothetical protein